MKKEKIRLFAISFLCIVMLFSSVISTNAEEERGEGLTVDIGGGDNIALDMDNTISWSGTWGSNEVDSSSGDIGINVFDGILGNKWGSQNVNDADAWISIEFSEEKAIGAIVIMQHLGGYSNILRMTIQYLDAQNNWVDLVYLDEEDLVADIKITAGNLVDTFLWDEYTYLPETALKTDGLRFYVKAADVGAPAVAVEFGEIEIYENIGLGTKTFYGGTGDTGVSTSEKCLIDNYYPDLEEVIAFASSENTAASNALDGDQNTKWSSTQPPPTPVSYTICLPEAINFVGASLYQDHYWSDVTAFIVEVMVNGNWVEVYSFQEGEERVAEYYEFILDTMWNTDVIRFTFTEVGDNCSRSEHGTNTTSIDFREILLMEGWEDTSTPKPTEDPNATPEPTATPKPTAVPSDNISFDNDDQEKGNTAIFIIVAIVAFVIIAGIAIVIVLKKKK